MRLLDTVINLVLKVYAKGNVVLVEPHIKPFFQQSSMKFCCKSFTISSSVGDEGIAKFIHREVGAQNNGNNVLTLVEAIKYHPLDGCSPVENFLFLEL